MKQVLILILIVLLGLSVTSCNQSRGTPEELQNDSSAVLSDVQIDNSSRFSYTTYSSSSESRPFIENNAEFPDNMFIYETNTPHIDDIKLYGYMDENFEIRSEPISLTPNVFSMGLARINSTKGSYIANKNFEEITELCEGYVILGNAIVKVSWENNVPAYITLKTIDNPDEYLVPVKIDTGTYSDEGKVWLYGYKTMTEYLEEGASDDDKFVISPVYEDARPFFNGLAAVKFNGKWGYIDNRGNTVIDFQYDGAKSFIETAAFVFKGEIKTIHYNLDSGKEAFEGYWALIDMEGNQLTDFNIRNANDFCDGWAIVEYAGLEKATNIYTKEPVITDTNQTTYNYIDSDGMHLWENNLNSSHRLEPFNNGFAIVSNGGLVSKFIDVKGHQVFGISFRLARPFSDGMAMIRIGSNRGWVYIDEEGSVVFEDKYLYAGDFNHGYAFVIKDFMSPGYVIDKAGNKYLEELNIYGMTKFNDEGYALAYTIVDKTETQQERLWYMIHIERN
jgi:hypothetical protein